MFKDKNTQNALGATIIILVIGFITWYIVRDVTPTGQQGEGVNTVKEGNIEALVESGYAEIDEIPVNLDLKADSIVRPELGRAIVMPERFTNEAIEILINNISTLTAQLKEDPNSFQAWTDLAAQYKIIDDFEGAIEIWNFLSIAAEGDTGSRINLGNLYHYQLREFEKSEAVFKDVIGINKRIVEAYTGLHELYRYSYKTDTTLAIDILKDAIVTIPDSIDLRMLLASYYTELGMKNEADAVYEDVLTMAQSAENTNLVTIVEAAIESLK